MQKKNQCKAESMFISHILKYNHFRKTLKIRPREIWQGYKDSDFA